MGHALKSRFILIVLGVVASLSSHAQKAFDSNCIELAQSKKYVHGSLELKDRTERYFIYDNLLPGYRSVIAQVNTVTKTDPSVSAACKGHSDVKRCLGFQAYCTETIASAGLQEDLKKWKATVELCLKPEYAKKFPSHCSDRALKHLLYVKDQAVWFSRAAATKNSGAEAFFKEASMELGQYADKMSDLIKAKKDEATQKSQTDYAKKLMDKCKGVVINDDDDVRGRDLAGKIGQSCELSPTDTTGAGGFAKELDKFNKYTVMDEVYGKVHDKALELTAMAIWATHSRNYGAMKPNPIDYLCGKEKKLCETPEKKKKLGLIYESFKKKVDKNPIPMWDSSERSKRLTSEFQPLVKEINAVCSESLKKFSAASFKSDSACRSGMAQCEAAKETWYRESKLLESDIKGRIDSLNRELLGSSLGYLYMAESFRKKVGELTPDYVYEKCMKGNGTLLNPPNSGDINAGMEEFYKLNMDELKRIVSEESDVKDRWDENNAMEDYIINNPESVGQLLAQNPNPEYAKLICSIIRTTHSWDTLKHKSKVAGAAVGGIAGVALWCTGVGAPAGTALLGAVGLSTTVLAATYASNTFNANKTLERSKLSGSTGQMELNQALEQIKSAEKEKSSELTNLIILLGTEAAGIGIVQSIKLLNKLEAGPRILRWLEGQAAARTFRKSDTESILSGLKNIKLEAEKLKFSDDFFDALTPEELLEMGAIFSKLSAKETKLALISLKNAGQGSNARLFLQELRGVEKINIASVQASIQKMGEIKLPDGQLLTPYLKQVDDIVMATAKMREPATSLSTSYLRIVKNAPGNATRWFVNGQKKYWSEVIETKGLRLIIKQRDVTQSRNFIKNPNAWLMNPVATGFNFKREATSLVTMPAYYLIVDRSLEKFQEKKKVEIADKAHNALVNNIAAIPGGNYSWDLAQQMGMSDLDLAKLLDQHDGVDFEKWYNGEASSLPRLDEIAQRSHFSSEETQALSRIARQNYIDEVKAYKQALAEGKIKGTEEDQAKLTDGLALKLKEKLLKDKMFDRFNEAEKDIFATAFYPLIPMGTHSDVEMLYLLMESENPTIKATAALVSQGARHSEVLTMAMNAVDQPQELAAKAAKAKKNLPEALWPIALRPDLPQAKRELFIKIAPGSEEGYIMGDEVDRWNVALSDPRFSDVIKQYNEGTATEVTAMRMVEEVSMSYNSLYDIIEKRGANKDLPAATVKEALGNPLLGGLSGELEEAQKKHNWSVQETQKRSSDLVNIFLDFHKAQALNEKVDGEALLKKADLVLGKK